MSMSAAIRFGCNVIRTFVLQSPSLRKGSFNVVSKRYNQSFGNDKVSYIKKFFESYQVQYTIWLCVVMLGSFQIVKVAQEYKFFGQSLDQPEKRSMNVDELERMKRKGKQTEDTKGMDSVMSQLYDEKVASKEFDDWDNIRFPRKSEPETIIAHHAKKIEKQSQKVEDEDTEFELTDYVKIDEKDIQFDFEDKEEIT